jgi:hypothetical protein
MFKNVGDVDAVLLDSPASVSTQTRNCLKEIVRLGRQSAQVARREAARRAAECIEIGAMDLTRGNEVRAFLGDYEGIFAFGVPNPGMFYSEIQNPFRSFMFDPLLIGLRADKRFADMMRSSGLLEYWRETGRHPDFCETENVQVCALINSK